MSIINGGPKAYTLDVAFKQNIRPLEFSDRRQASQKHFRFRHTRKYFHLPIYWYYFQQAMGTLVYMNKILDILTAAGSVGNSLNRCTHSL